VKSQTARGLAALRAAVGDRPAAGAQVSHDVTPMEEHS
jgi:hypothetical protein